MTLEVIILFSYFLVAVETGSYQMKKRLLVAHVNC